LDVELDLQNTQAAVEIVRRENLSCLRVPRIIRFEVALNEAAQRKLATEHTSIPVAFVEKMDLETRYYYVEELYEQYYRRFAAAPEWQESFRELFRQLTVFVCQSGFWDLKYDNLPLSQTGDQIALIDLDYGGQFDHCKPGDKKCSVKNIFLGGGNDNRTAVAPAILFDNLLETAANCLRVPEDAIVDPVEFSSIKATRQALLENHFSFTEWLKERARSPDDLLVAPANLILSRLEQDFLVRLNRSIRNRIREREELDPQPLRLLRTFRVEEICSLMRLFHPEDYCWNEGPVCPIFQPVLNKLVAADLLFSYQCDENAGLTIQG